jgi:hypothetical protein
LLEYEALYVFLYAIAGFCAIAPAIKEEIMNQLASVGSHPYENTLLLAFEDCFAAICHETDRRALVILTMDRTMKRMLREMDVRLDKTRERNASETHYVLFFV